MAVFYDVPAGKSLVIAGPAGVKVNGGEVPLVVDSAQEIVDAAPTLTALEPDNVEAGADDITLVVTGDGFDESSTIVFGEYDEPTTLSADRKSVSTGVKPSLFVPDTVPVLVRNGPARSAPLDFTFVDPGAGTTRRKKTHAKPNEEAK